MKKFLLLVVAVAVVFFGYKLFSDPEKRNQLLGTIEGSTGVDLESSPEKMLESAGRAVGGAADKLLKDLGDTLTDPAFHRSLEKWGRDALDRLDAADLDRLESELRQEANSGGADYDAILEKYLGDSNSS